MNALIDRSDGILTITLNRPERLNAITTEMITEVVHAIETAGEQDRVIALTGAGRAFCAGADLSGEAASPGSECDLPDASTIDAVNRLAITMTKAPQLVVALVNGPAVGVGSSIALGADLAVAIDRAYLKPGFEAIGLMPDGGGTAYLAAALGRSRALAVAVLGDRIGAEEARELGLVSRVWSAEKYTASSREFLVALANGPSRAQAAVKQAITRLTLDELPAALEFERRHQRALLASEDFAEGAAAFNEKRPARFSGK